MLENSIADTDICKESILKPSWVPNLGTALLHKTFPLLGRTLLTVKYINRNPKWQKGSVLRTEFKGMVAKPNSGRGAVSFLKIHPGCIHYQDSACLSFMHLTTRQREAANKRLRITTDSKLLGCKFKKSWDKSLIGQYGQAHPEPISCKNVEVCLNHVLKWRRLHSQNALGARQIRKETKEKAISPVKRNSVKLKM